MISFSFIEKNNSFRFLKNSFQFIKRKTFLSLILCLSIFIATNGQNLFPPAYKITSDTAAFLILPDSNWQAMPDVKENLTMEQVINSKGFGDRNKKINYKNDVYWQRFQLHNALPKELKIAFPVASFRADLFTKINDSKWKHYTTGTGVRWSRRDGLKRIPAFLIAIPSG